jgi:hypothetical protein
MPRQRAVKQPASVHQLKITLLGLEPPIWRRVAVPSDFSLGDLHHVIQYAMGWEQEHMHDFHVGRVTYADPQMFVDKRDRNEEQAILAEVVPRPRQKIRYLYDFGDSWEHEIQVEAIGAPEPGLRYPLCLAGERACPPEDCGGIWGYADLLEAQADPDNPENEELLEWLGGPIDPEAFDRDQVNKRLWAALR